MKKLIVASDFSREANHATEYAAQLAAMQESELILFNLYKPSIHAMNARASSTSFDELEHSNHREATAVASIIMEKYGVMITPYHATGDFFEEIVRCTEATSADLLVMGMAPKSIEQELLGNTTTSAIHKLSIPILSVPIDSSFNGINKILFAYDATHDLPSRALEATHDIAANFGADVEIFNVSEQAEQVFNQEDTQVIDEVMVDVTYYYKNVRSREIVKAIRDEMMDSESDLLVMAPQKHGFWDSLTHRSKTSIMASGKTIPLLSIPM
ncbi:universal stress protein [Marinoscillum sp.]|uniref:universal stress protein n=1 Tax=Marinoscillum sp. TaxID=2024838 RepID=UPI003BAA047F